MKALLMINNEKREVTRISGYMPFVLYDARTICSALSTALDNDLTYIIWRMTGGVFEELERWQFGKVLFDLPEKVRQ